MTFEDLLLEDQRLYNELEKITVSYEKTCQLKNRLLERLNELNRQRQALWNSNHDGSEYMIKLNRKIQ